MGRSFDVEELLQKATPTTRREILKRGAIAGISAPALLGLLRAPGALAEGAGCHENGFEYAEPSEPVVNARAAGFQGTPVQGGTMVVTGHQEIASLHPDDYGPAVHFVIVTQIHNGLLEYDENIQLVPVLAESYEVSPDGLTYTFKLRQGVKFHDGEEFTSADVKYNYEWYMDPANAAITASNFASIATVEAPDEYTVVVTLKEPYAPFLAYVAVTRIMGSKHHAAVGNDQYKAQPVGTGAFKLKEWRAAEYTEVDAFEEHFRGRPHLDIFRENIVPEASVRAIGLETGDDDSAVWPPVTEDSLRFAEDPNFTVFKSSSTAINHFPINNKLPQLSDKRVRQAMLYAIDRQKVIDDIFLGAAVIATANLSPAVAQYYNPDVPQYTYDPEKAKALLDEAGWVVGGDEIREKDGQKLTFTCTTITGDQARRPEAEVLQQYLRDVGIDMQLEEAPVATILEQLRSGNMDASLFNWTYGDELDPDASDTLKTDGASNFSQYSNPRVDELLGLGLREVDPEKRAEYYKELQAIVADEVPFLFMMFWDWYQIFAKRIKGLPPSALTGTYIYRKANEWWIEE